MQPVAAQSFKPDHAAGWNAFKQKDYATALKHYRSLAKQGHRGAQGALGVMYNWGYGVTRDYKEAVKWYRLSAKQGDANGMLQLGFMYQNGEGVVQDLVMAYVWLNVAVTNGKTIANDARDKLLLRLTASERKQARKLSKLCFKTPAKCPEYSDD